MGNGTSMGDPYASFGKHRSESHMTPERIVGYVAFGFIAAIVIECILGAGWVRIVSTILTAVVTMWLLRAFLRLGAYQPLADEGEEDDDVPVDTDDHQGHGTA